MIKQDYINFYSPGTFVIESTAVKVDSWDIPKAIIMAEDIKERHGAKPYGFRFTTRERGEQDLDSNEVASSNMYYLGGKILTLSDVKAKNDPKDKILISNMECHGWGNIIINNNSRRFTAPLYDGDQVLSE